MAAERGPPPSAERGGYSHAGQKHAKIRLPAAPLTTQLVSGTPETQEKIPPGPRRRRCSVQAVRIDTPGSSAFPPFWPPFSEGQTNSRDSGDAPLPTWRPREDPPPPPSAERGGYSHAGQKHAKIRPPAAPLTPQPVSEGQTNSATRHAQEGCLAAAPGCKQTRAIDPYKATSEPRHPRTCGSPTPRCRPRTERGSRRQSGSSGGCSGAQGRRRPGDPPAPARSPCPGGPGGARAPRPERTERPAPAGPAQQRPRRLCRPWPARRQLPSAPHGGSHRQSGSAAAAPNSPCASAPARPGPAALPSGNAPARAAATRSALKCSGTARLQPCKRRQSCGFPQLNPETDAAGGAHLASTRAKKWLLPFKFIP
uniref:translation initiation factor IF-2-like n=1 Tax=Agelaius phoeniceus TaxID=39638 RepID=UPI0023EAEE62|nr:translation initiation factor IF-2-like [Agelaius phoeniceus]